MENNRIEEEIPKTTAAERVAEIRKNKKLANEQSFWSKKLSRREAIGLGLTLGSAATIGGLVNSISFGSSSDTKKQTGKATSELQKSTEEIFKILDVNNILNLNPGSVERETAEHKYTNEILNLDNLKHLDQAFLFISNAEDRVKLLQKRGEYRKSGKFELKQLSKEEEEFCKANNFHEEWVAICIDSHQRTKIILQNKIAEMKGMENFIKQFRPDLENLIKEKKIDPKKISLDDIMLPIGALIGIAWSESKTTGKDGKIHALADIGKTASINHLTSEQAKQKERDLFKLLSVNGINYNAEKVFGSDKTGDIGSMQFNPETALAFIKFCELKGINFSFNPLGLDAVTAACLMLSIGQTVPLANGKEDFRMAYINGEEEDKSRKENEEEKKNREALFLHMKKSFQRWNGDLVNNILFWRNSYRQAMQPPQSAVLQHR